VPQHVRRTATIKADLESLFGSTRAFQQSGHAAGRPTTASLDDVIVLFHAPPYDTALDRAALDDTWVDHVPMDVHVGSIAIRRFIEARKPRITLHGHVHEAPRLTGRWQEKLGPTRAFTAAHDGPELAVVRFDPDHPGAATRELL
jgi:Icc-related predicted phosphoesterase